VETDEREKSLLAPEFKKDMNLARAQTDKIYRAAYKGIPNHKGWGKGKTRKAAEKKKKKRGMAGLVCRMHVMGNE